MATWPLSFSDPCAPWQLLRSLVGDHTPAAGTSAHSRGLPGNCQSGKSDPDSPGRVQVRQPLALDRCDPTSQTLSRLCIKSPPSGSLPLCPAAQDHFLINPSHRTRLSGSVWRTLPLGRVICKVWGNQAGQYGRGCMDGGVLEMMFCPNVSRWGYEGSLLSAEWELTALHPPAPASPPPPAGGAGGSLSYKAFLCVSQASRERRICDRTLASRPPAPHYLAGTMRC